mmetsp:Transcript_19507/g.60592  ORF Transcript_19507/g.60592 Transcript_19507/m.60592 type:complete len:278 (-) Transcript_19507:84-917(-)
MVRIRGEQQGAAAAQVTPTRRVAGAVVGDGVDVPAADGAEDGGVRGAQELTDERGADARQAAVDGGVQTSVGVVQEGSVVRDDGDGGAHVLPARDNVPHARLRRERWGHRGVIAAAVGTRERLVRAQGSLGRPQPRVQGDRQVFLQHRRQPLEHRRRVAPREVRGSVVHHLVGLRPLADTVVNRNLAGADAVPVLRRRGRGYGRPCRGRRRLIDGLRADVARSDARGHAQHLRHRVDEKFPALGCVPAGVRRAGVLELDLDRLLGRHSEIAKSASKR